MSTGYSWKMQLFVVLIVNFSVAKSDSLFVFEDSLITNFTNILRVPYGKSTSEFPIPPFATTPAYCPRMFYLHENDSTFFTGLCNNDGDFIFKYDLKTKTFVKKITLKNMLDFTLYNDSVIVLSPGKLTYYTLGLDSIAAITFPPIYRLTEVRNMNYFLLDYMFTQRYVEGMNAQYEFIYSLSRNKFISVFGEKEFFPVTKCDFCNKKILKDIIYKKPESSVYGQSNKYILYKVRDIQGKWEDRHKNTKYYAFNKVNNRIYNLNNIEKENIDFVTVRPFTAVNDSQFICQTIEQVGERCVVFKLMIIHSANDN